MSKFPLIANLKYANPITEEILTKTLSTTFEELGKEQRKQKWLYPKRDITILSPSISKAQCQTLFQFYIERRGSFSDFYFFWPGGSEAPYQFVKEYSFTGDGSTTVYNLPSTYASSYTLYKGTSGLTHGVDWNFGALAGTDGQDKCTLTAVSELGAYYSFTFTGYLVQRMRFKDDKLSLKHFYDKLVTTGLVLKGLPYES